MTDMELVSFRISLLNKFGRIIWTFIWFLLYRPSPIVCHGWRRFLLRRFGAKVGLRVHPYPTARIWAPWNLVMEDDACLSHNVICYNVAPVYLGKRVTVSQYSHLCTATHDYTDPFLPLLVAPIRIEGFAWVTADVFVGPGVTIGEGAVVNARSSVFSDIEAWTVAKGYPAKSYKKRVLRGIHE